MFYSVQEARPVINAWLDEYNIERPHVARWSNSSDLCEEIINNKKTCIELIRMLIDATTAYVKKLVESVQEMMLRLTGIDIGCCPQCGKGKLVYLRLIDESAYDDTS